MQFDCRTHELYMIAGKGSREAAEKKTPQIRDALGGCCCSGKQTAECSSGQTAGICCRIVVEGLIKRVSKLEDELCSVMQLAVVERKKKNKKKKKSRKCYRCGGCSHFARDCSQKYDIRRVKERLRNNVDVMLLDVVVTEVMREVYIVLGESRLEVLKLLKNCELDNVGNLKTLNKVNSETQRGTCCDPLVDAKVVIKQTVKISGVAKCDTPQNSSASKQHLQEHYADHSPSHTQTPYCSPSTSEQCQFVNFRFVDNRWKSPPYPPRHHPGFEYVDLVI